VSFPSSNAAIKPARSKDRPSPFFEAAQVSSVGIEMAVATFVGWGAGYWLDNRFETGPWLMLVGLLLGVVAGFRGLIRTANQVSARALTRKATEIEEQVA
jgi:ATP synthase protein I